MVYSPSNFMCSINDQVQKGLTDGERKAKAQLEKFTGGKPFTTADPEDIKRLLESDVNIDYEEWGANHDCEKD